MSRLTEARTLIVILLLPFIEGKSTENIRAILSSASEHYIFKPALLTCSSCMSAEGAFYTRKVDGGHVPEFEFSIVVNGTTYHIHLELNKGLIPPGFSASYLGYDWETPKTYKEETPEQIDNCYYHGYVIGVDDSHVAASTCYGLKGSIYLPNDVVHFAPLGDDSFDHVLYREDTTTDDLSCGTAHHDIFNRPFKAATGDAAIRRKRSEEEQRYVELLLVANKELYEKFDTMVDLHEYIKEIVNYMDYFYQKIGLRVVLLHLEVWTKEDKIVETTHPGDILEDFMAYRGRKIQESGNPDSPWKYTDNAQLIFGGDFDGNILGKASISTMCTARSAGVNQHRDTARNTASTMTHEMGHNFGMNHDDGSCNCPVDQCIMAASASPHPPDGWSDCSSQYLEAGFRNGLGVCLLNELDSSKLFGGPRCGNSIVEADEECDCGSVEDCDSKCCNASTCKLLAGALCDDGACCTDDCKFRNNCHVCRTQKSDCDITEYCSGESAHCPSNIHKIDGVECNDNSGYCHSGVCRIGDEQCKDLWGQEASKSGVPCYEYLNKLGDWKGNCGLDKSGQFIACAEENLMCGKMICQGGEYKPVISSSKQAAIMSVKGNQCKSIQTKNGTLDTVHGDISYVYDGTRCGDGKVCYDNECVDMSAVYTPCTKNCHGHGVCNNFGNCHCDAGYAPPNCDKEGHGGSADSGPICANATYERPAPAAQPDNKPTEAPETKPDEETEKKEEAAITEAAVDPGDNQATEPDTNDVTDPPVEVITEIETNQTTAESGVTVATADFKVIFSLAFLLGYLL